MFIVHVVRQFHPGVGGLESVVHELASAQVGAGHRVRVVTLDRLFNVANRQQTASDRDLRRHRDRTHSVFRLVSLSDRARSAPAHQGRRSGSRPRYRFLLRLSRLDQADPWPHACGFDPWRLFSYRLCRLAQALLVFHRHPAVDEILRRHRRGQRVGLRTVPAGASKGDGMHRERRKRREVRRCVIRHFPEIDLVDRPLCQEQEDRSSDRFCAGVAPARSRMDAHHRRPAGRFDGGGRRTRSSTARPCAAR